MMLPTPRTTALPTMISNIIPPTPKTMPAIREAIEAGDWPEAQREITNVANVLQAEARLIDQIAAAMSTKH